MTLNPVLSYLGNAMNVSFDAASSSKVRSEQQNINGFNQFDPLASNSNQVAQVPKVQPSENLSDQFRKKNELENQAQASQGGEKAAQSSDIFKQQNSSRLVFENAAMEYRMGKNKSNSKLKAQAADSAQPCQTCAERTYQDESNDIGVSFKSAQSVAPQAAASAVMSHEREHVANNKADAAKEGGEVISSNVRLTGGICEECGQSYISGGVTETVRTTNSKNAYLSMIKRPQSQEVAPLLNMAV